MKTEFSGECDWCRKEADDLVEHQDFEEGLAGQKWVVCSACRKKESDSIDRELAEYDSEEQPYGFESECYMDANGYCSMQGTEHCDWDCPEGGC